MSRSINNVVLVGRLTRDPELRTTGNGTSVTTFTLAVDRQYGKDKQADFISCVAWKKNAEFVQQYGSKGRMVGLTGSIHTRHYTGKDGKEVYVTEVWANSVSFLDSRSSNQGQGNWNGQQGGYQAQQGQPNQGKGNYKQDAWQGQQGANSGTQQGSGQGQAGFSVSSDDLPF